MSGWDYPDFRDDEPPEDREFWEDEAPDHWWADWPELEHERQYEADQQGRSS